MVVVAVVVAPIRMAAGGCIKQLELRFQPGNHLETHKWFSSTQGHTEAKTALPTQDFSVSQVRKGDCNQMLSSCSWRVFPPVPEKCWMEISLPRIWETL